MITKSENNLPALFKALAEAQGKIIDPKKDITVDGEDGQYQAAPLSKFFDNVTVQFKKVGLFYSQNLTGKPGEIGISTFIGHEGGGWLETDVYWLGFKTGEESIAIYSAKKASLCAAAGITGKNQVEAKEKKNAVVSFYGSAAERTAMKQKILVALSLVTREDEFKEFLGTYEKDIENLTAEDPEYVSDVLRDIKARRNQFSSEGQNLKNKI